MKQTYYEILEVDKNASPEIIKKAYNTLAKKYHPDLQNENLKALYSEKLKIINEAYETLSNEEKRKEYDETLLSEIDLLKQQVANLSKENSILKNKNANYNNNVNNQDYFDDTKFNNQINQMKQQAYYDAYIQDLKSRGYKIKSKKSFKDYLKDLLALILTFIIFFLLWQIPFFRNFILNNTIK